MRPIPRLICLAMLLPAAAGAQPVAVSPRPDSVAVTVYRNPYASPGSRLNLSWLNGYALITETRRVTIPAGESELRFEGVAGGILPQSAIVAGLPDTVGTPICSRPAPCSIARSAGGSISPAPRAPPAR